MTSGLFAGTTLKFLGLFACIKGTENVAYIVGLARALELVQKSWAAPEWPCTQQQIAAAAAAASSNELDSSEANQTKETGALAAHPPHPSKLAFTAKVFVEAFWATLEQDTKSSRQLRKFQLYPL